VVPEGPKRCDEVSSGPLAAADVLAVLKAACRADVMVFKPGNVSLRSPGHGMCAQDFLLSAEVSLPCLLERDMRLGERVHAAVAATRRAVGCNTNLGILLLLAPLAEAALGAGPGGLPERLAACLVEARAEPARAWFDAIRLAAPGGLGTSDRFDVSDTACTSATLGDAMQHAAPRDRIARQYVSDYADVFEIGVRAVDAVAAGDAMLAAYLAFLTRFDDTHVLRKFGAERAAWVRAEARPVAALLKACDNPAALTGSLEGLDEAFKRVGVNPGTSADLAVASLAAAGLIDLLAQGQKGSGAHAGWFDAAFQQH
jgi:triphosphoribosyl-dephospho-CoA synthase